MICMILSFACAVLISYSYLQGGELQENWTTDAVTLEFCPAKASPLEIQSPSEPKADCYRA